MTHQLPSSSHHRKKCFPFVSCQNTFTAVCRAQRARQEPMGQMHFPMGLSKEGGSRAQADPRPHCPPRRPRGVPGCCGGWGADSLAAFPARPRCTCPALRGEGHRTVSEASLQPEENGFHVLEGVRGPFHQHEPFPGLGGQVLQKLVLGRHQGMPRDAKAAIQLPNQ